MWTTNVHRARPAAALGGWAALACAALPVTACSSSASSAASSGSSAASTPAAGTFLAEGQDVNGTALYEPACAGSGCPLSGDGTTILYRMRWTTWSATEAVGTGTYKVDACQPSCAAGPVYPVAAVVTLSQPVKVCSASGTRWFWSYASFQVSQRPAEGAAGQHRHAGPLDFSFAVSAAQQELLLSAG